MIRGTTPDYVLTVNGYDLSDKTVLVTIAQGRKQVTKTGDQLSIAYSEGASTIAFVLTQMDTFSLSEGDAFLQVRFIDENGIASATEIVKIAIDKVLLEKVIAYDGNSD